jgi:GH25 family lysozyme M1 (1,4-beta-N-acetylmuramidase)/fibronectin type 3 domain-containing protein
MTGRLIYLTKIKMNEWVVILKKQTKRNGLLYFFAIMVFSLGLTIALPYTRAAAYSLSAPAAIKAVSTSYHSITVSWSSVRGASGYRVYKATSKTGTYSLIKVTSARNYISSGLTAGKTYYYKVRAFKIYGSSRIYGSLSAIAAAKPIPQTPASVKAISSSYQSITVSWNRVAGAGGYRIYKSDSREGTYAFLAETTAANFISNGLTAGKTYYYKVKAYSMVGSIKVYGNSSSPVYAKPVLQTPIADYSETSADTIHLYWGTIEGASGYRVYRSTSMSGTYFRTADISTTDYEDTGLYSGTVYYYKVRAYITVGGSNVYSGYSSIVSAETAGVPITQISLNKDSDTLILGESDTLTAAVTPESADNQSLTWESSDPLVASVDSTGTITTISAGTADITVSTADGSVADTCTVTVNNAEIKGIDVSKWQGTINWASMENAGIQFAMMRSSYGSSSVDPMFETNYENAKANNMPVGVYHYSYATTVAKAAAEVNFMLNNLKGKQFEYPVCVDMEDVSQKDLGRTTLTNIALTYLNTLKQAGYYPIIYTTKYWFTTKLDYTQLTAYDLWLAQWGTEITYTDHVGIWQYSSTGILNGINAYVDLDLSFINYEARIKSLHLNGF